ncbi:acetyl-CoA C-acetyltransferase [Mycobacterium asiaticum]|uniref:acetyl-CoA C-acetyltransferase n=1 Tax=Mycobacterium asiaticum TaxID=1790 RepID=UPI00056AB9BD|nr:acetyl-CoA C-acetyltransferase [Mycobacterium asiaticum]ORA15932.1 acetyl-CoA acetyltransferase [Mycobacterium asiaticum DSM 44297]
MTTTRPAAFIVDAARTPVAKRNGGLKDVHPADLGAHIIRNVADRNDFDPSAVDDVILGVCDQLGPQAGDVARTCWLAAGLPDDVPGVTVDRQCGSSQQAVHFAAQAVMSGTQDLVIAGGVQNMSMIPISAAYTAAERWGLSDPFSGSAGWTARYGAEEVSQFRAADLVAEKWQLTRPELDEYGLESHRRAIHAIDHGWFDREIVPLAGVTADEGPRRDTSPERMSALSPLRPGGTVTAGHASQISDAASAVLIASERAVADHGLTPRARIHHLDVRADDPILMLTAPIRATHRALSRCGLSIEDIDLIEINEAFAPVPMAFTRELGANPAVVNVAGGAIALGHPIGATGTRLLTTLLHALERTSGRYGLLTICEGGGQANVTIIERI